jgi:EmrB/QacA subfamily drug resistance transporter
VTRKPEGNLLPGQPYQRTTLVAMILCSGIVFLQSTVVNVALPSLGRELDTGLSGLQWIVDGYILTLAALLIPGGSLGDRYGRRRTMIVGLVGFGATSTVGGLAPTVGWLIGARILQGVAGALLVPGSLAILRDVYTEREVRGEAIGQWSGWSGISTVIGPLVGGWLVDNLSWRWVFFVAVPLIAAAVWLMVRYVPESRAEDAPQRLDWLGALLVMLGLGGVAYGLIEGPVVGWRAPGVLTGLVGGVISLFFFPFVEARQDEPMVPLTLFRSRNFTGANLTTLGVYFALQGTSFFVVLYLQNVMGYSALTAGLVLAPTSLLLLVLSPVFGKMSGERGARLFMTVGPLVCGVGLFLFTRLSPDAGFWTRVLPATVVFGLGMSVTVAPLTDTVMSAVSDRYSGIAAAVNNVTSRVAGLLAVAGLGVVVTLTFRAVVASRIADLSLSPSATEAIERVAEEPTGGFDIEQLPPEASEAVASSYTVGFRRAMIVSASMAALGGIVAAITIQDTGSGQTSRTDQGKDG